MSVTKILPGSYFGVEQIVAEIKQLSNLVLCLPMQEKAGATVCKNVAPATRGTMNATISGAAPEAVGQKGTAFDFVTAESDYIDLGNSANLVAGTGSFTFGGIFYIPTNGAYIVLCSRSAAGQKGYDILFGTNTDVRARIQASSEKISPSTTLTTNAYHFLIAVVDKPNNKFRFYADGNQISTGTDITGFGDITNTQNPMIARRGSGYATTKVECLFMTRGVVSDASILYLAQLAGLA